MKIKRSTLELKSVTGPLGLRTGFLLVLMVLGFTGFALEPTKMMVTGISVTDMSGNTNNDGIICSGASATLTADGLTGGSGRQWFLDQNSNNTYEAGTDTDLGTNASLVVAGGSANFPAGASRTVHFRESVTVGMAVTLTYATRIITVNVNPSCSASSNSPICPGAPLNLSENGGTGTSWSWTRSGSATFDNATSRTPVASNVSNNEVFTVVVTNANGCTSTCNTAATVRPMSVPPPPPDYRMPQRNAHQP